MVSLGLRQYRCSKRANANRRRTLSTESLEIRTLLSASELDLSFGDSGRILFDVGDTTSDSPTGIATETQADGKILIGLSTYHWTTGTQADFAVIRYNADGSPDMGFGNQGTAVIDFGNSYDTPESIAVDREGRIVIAGMSQQGTRYDFAFARLTSNGQLDTEFDLDGKKLLNLGTASHYLNEVAIDDSGRIVLAGYVYETGIAGYRADGFVARLEESGELDTDFAGTGKFQIDINQTHDILWGIAIDSENRILATGNTGAAESPYASDFLTIRLTDSGMLDTGFASSGISQIDLDGHRDYAYDVTTDSQGRIIVGGYSQQEIPNGIDFSAVRLLQNGRLDEEFSEDGKWTKGLVDDYGYSSDDYVRDVAVDAQDRIVLMGRTRATDIAALRLTTDGVADQTFGNNGVSLKDIGSGRGFYGGGTMDSSGRLVFAAAVYRTSSDVGVLRMTADGLPDASFGTDGVTITDIGAPNSFDTARDVMVTQPDGKILIAGSFRMNAYNASGDFFVARYHADGSPDLSFGTDGIARIDFAHWFSEAYSMAVDSQGRIIVGGTGQWGGNYAYTDFLVTRLTPDGFVDTTFNRYGMDNYYGYAGLQRVDLGGYDEAKAVAVDSEDNIIIAGRTLQDYAQGGSNIAVVRLNQHGFRDGDFGTFGVRLIDLGDYNETATDMLLDADGKILISGATYNSLSESNDGFVLRILPDGSSDTTFAVTGTSLINFGGAWEGINAISLDPAGNILAAGWSQSADWSVDFAVARLTPAGLLDNTFSGDGTLTVGHEFPGAYDYAGGISVDGSGTIIVGGASLNANLYETDFSLIKLAPDGKLIESFGTGGWELTQFGESTDWAHAVTVDAEDRILLAGNSWQSWPKLSDTAVARYQNAGANLTGVSVSQQLGAVGQEFTVSADVYFNINRSTIQSAVWQWGDGTSSPAMISTGGAMTLSANHTYSSAGLYTVTLIVTDSEGVSRSSSSQQLVVYDPNAGFVTGAGTIESPAGSWAYNPSATGNAVFAFYSKYRKGTNIPDGTTSFRLRTAGLDFISRQYRPFQKFCDS